MNDGTALAVRALERLVAHKDLGAEGAEEVAQALIEGSLPPELVGALLTALAAKGESPEELFGFARALRARARHFPGPSGAGAVDLCGTGGARTPSFNVSTVSSFVLSAAGVPVAKHGNFSSRGMCGSTDLLDALGLPVSTSVPFAEACWRDEQLCFLHAPLYHTATKGVAPIRRSLGIRTIFNQLGPLTNPAGVRVQLVGSGSEAYARLAVAVLRKLKVERVLAVHSSGGMDEFSSQDPTWSLRSPGKGVNDLAEETFDPKRLLPPSEREGDLSPRMPAEAARLAEEVLQGKGDGAVRGSVLLTAGAVLWLTGKVEDLGAGVSRARRHLEDGSARDKLERLRALARSGPWDARGP